MTDKKFKFVHGVGSVDAGTYCTLTAAAALEIEKNPALNLFSDGYPIRISDLPHFCPVLRRVVIWWNDTTPLAELELKAPAMVERVRKCVRSAENTLRRAEYVQRYLLRVVVPELCEAIGFPGAINLLGVTPKEQLVAKAFAVAQHIIRTSPLTDFPALAAARVIENIARGMRRIDTPREAVDALTPNEAVEEVILALDIFAQLPLNRNEDDAQRNQKHMEHLAITVAEL